MVTLGAPGYLGLLALVGVAAIAIGLWMSWRGRAGSRLGVGASRRWVWTYAVPAGLLATLAIIAFAAARPQFGDDEVELEERGIALVVVLDVSQSMLAQDAEPTRLGRAQQEISALLGRMQGDRAGLVIFAGNPFVRAPLTSDLGALARMVEGVGEERGLVRPGSDLGRAIREGTLLVRRGDADSRVLLVVSDGEDHGASIPQEIANARAAGVRVYTAGVGTADGAPVRDVDEVTGELVDRVDPEGAPVVTRLDERALREMAADGSGRYVELAGEDRRLAALASEFDGLKSTLFESREESQAVERFQIFVAVGLALLAAVTVLPALLAPRTSAERRRWRVLWPLAGAGLLVAAVCGSDVSDLNRQGNNLYGRGDFAAALERYREAQAKDASLGELYYNASNALNRQSEFSAAVEEAGRALPADDELEALVQYAIGNHNVGMSQLQDAIEAYRRALLADPDDDDAKHNLEVVTARLEPTPTPTPPAPPDIPPTPEGEGGDDPLPQPGDEDSEGDPGGDGAPATPGPPGEPQDPSEALLRSLEEALLGIDSEFTVEEALQALDLLEETNRRQLERPGPGAPGGPPDY